MKQKYLEALDKLTKEGKELIKVIKVEVRRNNLTTIDEVLNTIKEYIASNDTLNKFDYINKELTKKVTQVPLNKNSGTLINFSDLVYVSIYMNEDNVNTVVVREYLSDSIKDKYRKAYKDKFGETLK